MRFFTVAMLIFWRVSTAQAAAGGALTAGVLHPRMLQQGIDNLYGFNDEAALGCFAAAAAQNADCVMCHWGSAQALLRLSGFVDDPTLMQRFDGALAQAEMALDHEGERAHPLHRALVRATQAARSAAGVDAALYAAALYDVYRAWPEENDVGAMLGLALLGTGSCHGTRAGFYADDAPVFAVLEGVLRRDPHHLGAHHFYIHACERSMHPEWALWSASELPGLAPHLGHMVHMPSHIYLRLGELEAAQAANVAAIAADEALFAGQADAGAYYDFFYLHNQHFLWFVTLAQGNRHEALIAARRLKSLIRPQTQRNMFAYDMYATAEMVTYIRLQSWEEALQAHVLPESGPYARMVEHLAHGLAYLAQGHVQAAEISLREMRSQSIELQLWQPLPQLAQTLLQACILQAQGDWPHAARLYEQAIAYEDSLSYGEPWSWQLPIRDFYAEALFSRGNFTLAVQQCDAELQRHPNSSAWTQALRARAQAAVHHPQPRGEAR